MKNISIIFDEHRLFVEKIFVNLSVEEFDRLREPTDWCGTYHEGESPRELLWLRFWGDKAPYSIESLVTDQEFWDSIPENKGYLDLQGEAEERDADPSKTEWSVYRVIQ